jgi:methionyl-tRNA synthetase
MANTNTFYITTSIPYVNASPHIGFAIELLQADILARWHRLIGDDTFFLTGTDENTLKLIKSAAKEGTQPQELADKYAGEFQRLTEVAAVTNDAFIRTTDEAHHHPGATKVWQALDQAGFIYKGEYSGKYCVDCEQFYTDKEITDNACPVHQTPLEQRSEENYLFKLSAFTDQIREALSSGTFQIQPETRRNEILGLLKGGLQDVSFSRPADKLTMGVPVPGDASQRMYVWCDALTNYLTGIGYGWDDTLFERFWPADVHIIGKDIIRFHAAIWPAMLLGAGITLPKLLYVHGHITIDGAKMSKSKGNVVDPFALFEQKGVDPVRYYLARALPFAGDGDYSESHFQEVYDSELANDFGNLVSRVIAMIDSGYEGIVPEGTIDPEVREEIGQTWQHVKLLFDECRLTEAIDAMNALASRTNKYIERKQPFHQEGQEKENTLFTLAQVVGNLAMLYAPILPNTAAELQRRLGLAHRAGEVHNVTAWEKLPAGTKVVRGEPLFPKHHE